MGFIKGIVSSTNSGDAISDIKRSVDDIFIHTDIVVDCCTGR